MDDDGLASLTSHTHGRHVPHLTLAALGDTPLSEAREAVAALPEARPERVLFQAFGSFPRSRCSLVPAISGDLLRRHERAVQALLAAEIPVHRHYLPGAWLPHLTVATRSPVEALPGVARRVYEILPLAAVIERAALVDTSSGEVHLLPRLI